MRSRTGTAHLALVVMVIIVIAAAGTAFYLATTSQQESSTSTNTTTLSGLTMINATSSTRATGAQSSTTGTSNSTSLSTSSTSTSTSPNDIGSSTSQSQSNTTQPNPFQIPVSYSSSTNSTTGLSVLLSLVGFPNGTINIHAYEQNVRNSNNNLTAANRWPYPAGAMRAYSGSCSDALIPFGIVVLNGYFDASDYPSGQALVLYNSAIPGTSCTTQQPIPTSFGFAPMDDSASVYAPQLMGLYPVNIDLLTSGSWTSNGSSLQFTRFHDGNYTVIAGDEWGQLLILHFGVVSITPSPATPTAAPTPFSIGVPPASEAHCDLQ